MPNKQRQYRVQVRIRDIGDEPLNLFLLGIAQRPTELGNARLISWSALNWIMDAIGDKNLGRQVRYSLENEGECTIPNVVVPEAWFSDPFLGDIFAWLVELTKKANQSDGLKRAFQRRKEPQGHSVEASSSDSRTQ